MLLQDLSKLNESLGIWDLVAYFVIALIIIVIIFYALNKMFQMRYYNSQTAKKPRIKSGKRSGGK